MLASFYASCFYRICSVVLSVRAQKRLLFWFRDLSCLPFPSFLFPAFPSLFFFHLPSGFFWFFLSPQSHQSVSVRSWLRGHDIYIYPCVAVNGKVAFKLGLWPDLVSLLSSSKVEVAKRSVGSEAEVGSCSSGLRNMLFLGATYRLVLLRKDRMPRFSSKAGKLGRSSQDFREISAV